MARQSFFVLSPVSYDRRYKAGETIEMERAEALQLLDLDVICDPDDPRVAAFGTDPVDEGAAAALDQAFDALRQASANEVRAFFERAAEDPEIRAKLDEIVLQAGRHERLAAAIAGLEEGNEAHWTRSGKPEVRALQEAAGLDGVTAAERDAAWEAFQAERGGGE